MQQNFNPYQQWLGIGQQETPPNYYRLVGMAPFEQDGGLIAHSADRMIAYVRSLSPGPHMAAWQSLLDELARAKQCLTDPAQKAAYDAHLRARMSAPPSAIPTGQPQAWVPRQPAPQPVYGGASPAHPPQGWAQAGPPQAAPVARPIGAPQAQPVAAVPVHPVGQAAVPRAVAVPVSEPAGPIVAAGSSARNQLYRRRKKSAAPAVLGLGLVACILGFVAYMVLGQKEVPLQEPVAAAPPEPAVRRVEAPPARTLPMEEPDRKPQERPRRQQTVESTGGIAIPGLKYGEVQETPADRAEEPEADAKMEAVEQAVESLSVPESSAAPMPAEMTEDKQPESAEPTAEQAEAFDTALQAAYLALGERDWESAQQHLAAAEPVAISEQQQSRLRGMRLVEQSAQSFWEAVRDGLQGLVGTTEELELPSGGRVRVVEATPDLLILRVAGENRRYTLDSMPSGLAVLLANRWFDANAGSTKLFIGAFRFVDPTSKKDGIRQLWEQAELPITVVEDLLPLLEMKKG